jgi:hypothetical protein
VVALVVVRESGAIRCCSAPVLGGGEGRRCIVAAALHLCWPACTPLHAVELLHLYTTSIGTAPAAYHAAPLLVPAPILLVLVVRPHLHRPACCPAGAHEWVHKQHLTCGNVTGQPLIYNLLLLMGAVPGGVWVSVVVVVGGGGEEGGGKCVCVWGGVEG